MQISRQIHDMSQSEPEQEYWSLCRWAFIRRCRWISSSFGVVNSDVVPWNLELNVKYFFKRRFKLKNLPWLISTSSWKAPGFGTIVVFRIISLIDGWVILLSFCNVVGNWLSASTTWVVFSCVDSAWWLECFGLFCPLLWTVGKWLTNRFSAVCGTRIVLKAWIWRSRSILLSLLMSET